MVLVGALNVGCMDVDCVPELRTNALRQRQPKTYSLDACSVKKGQRIGQFNLGSTVVLLFPPKVISESQSAFIDWRMVPAPERGQMIRQVANKLGLCRILAAPVVEEATCNFHQIPLWRQARFPGR